MTTKTQILHCVAIQPINDSYYNIDNEYIHNTVVDSQPLAKMLFPQKIEFSTI